MKRPASLLPARLLKTTSLVIALTLVSACQTQPEMRQLQDENRQLRNDLGEARKDIDTLKAQELLLRREIDELNRVIGVLDVEKATRTQESSDLRGQVRRFVQAQIDQHREFLVQGDLLDYVGGELVERGSTEDRSLMLVDMANVIPRSGSLTGVGAHFVAPGSFVVKVLRPVDGNLVVIWESPRLHAEAAGIQQIAFPVNVGVERGDVIGYYFPTRVPVSFDEGTGDTRHLTSDLALGSSTRVSSLQGERRRRAYSLGVYGLLN